VIDFVCEVGVRVKHTDPWLSIRGRLSARSLLQVGLQRHGTEVWVVGC
jgi:hypothetical protein